MKSPIAVAALGLAASFAGAAAQLAPIPFVKACSSQGAGNCNLVAQGSGFDDDTSWLTLTLYDHTCTRIGGADVRPNVLPTYPDGYTLTSQLPKILRYTHYPGRYGNYHGLNYDGYISDADTPWVCDQDTLPAGGINHKWHWCAKAFPCKGF